MKWVKHESLIGQPAWREKNAKISNETNEWLNKGKLSEIYHHDSK